jgi:prophage regulatory protein
MAETLSPLLNIRAVTAATTLPSSSIRAAVTRGEFPAPVQLGLRRVAWRSADIQGWIDSLTTQSTVTAFKGAA